MKCSGGAGQNCELFFPAEFVMTKGNTLPWVFEMHADAGFNVSMCFNQLDVIVSVSHDMP